MMFTLNGEILLDDSGSELAFKDFDAGDGKCCIKADGTGRLSVLVLRDCHLGLRERAREL